MKRCLLAVPLLIIAAQLCLGQNQNKVATAIVDLDARNLSQMEIATLSDRFRAEIFNTNVFDILEREKMGEILKEQGFQQTGACNDACVIEIGKLVGVRKMIAGSISHIGALYSINTRLIDVGTGRVEQSVVVDYSGDLTNLLTKEIRKIAITLAFRFQDKPIPDSLQLQIVKKPVRAKKPVYSYKPKSSYLSYLLPAGFTGASILAYALSPKGDNSTGFAFLRIPVKARAAAMGEAVVAVSDDPSGQGYNPAGLPLMRTRQASAGFLNYVSGIQAGNISWVQPLDGLSTAAAGLTYLNSGSIKETTIDDPLGESLGSFTYSSFALTASYGRCFDPQWYAGASIKGAYEKAKEYTSSGVAMDLGVLYEVDLQSIGDRIFKPAQPGNYGTSLVLGASVQNAGFATKAFVSEKAKMPLLVRAGLAYRPFMNKLTVALAGVKPADAPFAVQAGGEYWIKGTAALRLGYNGLYGSLQNGSSTDDFSGLSAGLGMRFRKYRIDFAYTPYAGLGNPMRVDISAEF